MDVETTLLKHGEKPKTKFWGYYDGFKYRKFKTTSEFLKFLRQQPGRNILHHANFDVIQLLLDGADINILKSHNGRLIKCSLGEHVFTNTFSCFPVALAKIFAAFGHKKTELDRLDKRNYDDCVVGLECFLAMDDKFQRLIGVSPLQKGTIAGTGFGAAELVAGRMPKDLRFVNAYRGGRVELYDARQTMCSNYDINSSYPKSFIDAPKMAKLFHVTVRTGDYYCPLFDAGTNERLVFPNGCFNSWVYDYNLDKYLIPNWTKTSLKILSRHEINFRWFEKLRELIQVLFERKQTTTDKAERECCKFALNAFYGRIGLRGESEQARILNYELDGDDITRFYIGKKRWLTFNKVNRESRSNYPFAAFITDNARARWYQSAVQNRALYGDTDSVFSPNKPGQFVGRIGEGLGEWSFKKTAVLRARNVKDYEFDGKETLKGGKDHLMWTLKQFASGGTVESVHRTRQTTLQKRLLFPDGTTQPLTVKQ